MLKNTGISESYTAEQLELKGFTRSIIEIEWLLLILVLLYFVSPGVEIGDQYAVVLSIIRFTGFIIDFHYFNFFYCTCSAEDSNRDLDNDSVFNLGSMKYRKS